MEVTSFCLFLLGGCIFRWFSVFRNWFWLVLKIGSRHCANRAVMIFRSGAIKVKTSKQRPCQVKNQRLA